MELTEGQKKGLKIALERYDAGEKYVCISGLAGTGKSTLVKFLISALETRGIDPDIDVSYAAFTGKAAQVLKEKGCNNAKTLHKLLYKTIPKPDGSFIFVPKEELEYYVVVVDECSMMPKEMWDLLTSYPDVFIIALGDPGQLPALFDSCNILNNPHIFLDEVMRQAADSGIIELSMKVRNEEDIKGFSSSDARVLPKDEFVTGMLTWADITLCATNNTKDNLNNLYRQILNKNGIVDEEEKLICNKNYWDVFSIDGEPLTNGCIGYFKNIKEESFVLPDYLYPERFTLLRGDFVTETGELYPDILIDKKLIEIGKPTFTNKQRYAISKNKKYKKVLPLEFSYGYAITTHRSQGSEWEKVLVVEEGFPFKKEEHKQWMYTACTRASSRLTVLTA